MNGQMPPEIVYIKNVASKIPGGKKGILIGALIILALFFVQSMFFSVQPDQDAVIQRFGKYVRTVGPGLHFKLPAGIEKVTKVRTRAILKEEFGFETVKAGIRTQYSRQSQNLYKKESIMLTGDLNVADVEWIVQFQIADPKAFLFNVRNVKRNVRDLSEAVMRQVVGDREVTEVLTYGRLDIEEMARELLQEILTEYQTGVQVVTVKLQDVNPPDEVKPSFNEVNEAKQESDQLVNEAWKAYNQLIPEARGKAEQAIAQAEGFAIKRINRSKGDAERFINLQEEYSKAKQVTRKRLYLESLQDVLGRIDQVYVIDPDLKSLVPLLDVRSRQGAVAKEAP
jgi:membrane protease subunit HflK